MSFYSSMSTTTDSVTTVQPVTVTPEVTTRFTGQTDEAFPFNSEVSTCGDNGARNQLIDSMGGKFVVVKW